MAKWADYLISAVRYNQAGTHIDRVMSHPDNGDSVGTGSEVTRQRVVALLDGGTTFMTIYKNPNDSNKWVRGAEVGIVTIDGTKYIRTDADKTKLDNLGDLPTF
jgi:hypothetical protein